MRKTGRARRIAAALLLAALLVPVFSFAQELTGRETALTEEILIKTGEGANYDRVIDIAGEGFLYYAQNNDVFRMAGINGDDRVGKTGCAATTLATVLVNQADYEMIDTVAALAPDAIRIDTMNINTHGGRPTERKFPVEEKCDYCRYLPICILNIEHRSHMRTSYFDKYLNAYGLEFQKTRDVETCLTEIRERNALVIVCSGTNESPVSPDSGHYLVLAKVADGYVYCMDTYVRDKYPADKKHLIELLEPGLFRVQEERVRELFLTGTKFIVYPATGHRWTQEEYDGIVAESLAVLEKHRQEERKE